MQIPAQRIRIPKKDRAWIQGKIDDIFETGQMAYGHWVAMFEKEFARFTGTKYAVATGSGTQALEVSMRALKHVRDVQDGIVVLPTNTYMASLFSIRQAGSMESLCDIESDLNISARLVANHICVDGPMSKRTGKGVEKWGVGRLRAIGVMVVHIGGNIVQDIGAIRDYCQENNLFLIEDCAHAHGSVLNGKKAGTFGDVGCFSFYPTKVMTVGGEGGMLVTDNKDVYEYARRYRHCGRDPPGTGVHAYHTMPGHNYCMDEIRAVIGLSQLGRLGEYIRYRSITASRYKKKFDIIDYPGSNYYKIITMNKLKGPENIHFPGKVYEVPCHLQPIVGFKGMYPNAEKYCRGHSVLPVYNDMTMEEVEYVIENVEVAE